MMPRACCRGPHKCTFQLLPRHNEVLLWMYSTCSATRREHHTKSQRPEWQSIYQLGERCPFGADNWGQVNRIRMKRHKWQMVIILQKKIKWSQVSTCTLQCNHSTLGSPHPMPEKFSSCNVPSVTYNTWQPLVTWYVTRFMLQTNMKYSSHQGKTYKL